MPVHLYVSPAGGGKTTFLVECARAQALNLSAAPRVLVPTQLQARAWKRRLAEAGGALGVRVGTFDALYRDILHAAGQSYIHLSAPLQYRLLRALTAQAPLVHYEPLRAAPGFIQVVQDLIREWKAGGVFPEALIEAIQAMGSEPRLLELADLYLAYQQRLQREGWADTAGIGWLAAEALEDGPDLGREWSSFMIDGFDDLTSVQLIMLRRLAEHGHDLTITLTGQADGRPRPWVQQRSNHTRERLEAVLKIKAEPLPQTNAPTRRAPALAHLEATLLTADASCCPADGTIALVAAPDREGEVRAALRWLKERMVVDGLRPGQVALLARTMEPYVSFIAQVADEYGLPVYIVSGHPLRSNPAIAALLDLLRLSLPGEETFSWRLTVETWRSPYLASLPPGEGMPGKDSLDLSLQDAQRLDQVARWGSVIGGLEQWREALDRLVEADTQAGPAEDVDQDVPSSDIPVSGAAAQALRAKFERFVRRVAPPAGEQTYRTLVSWLEDMIGDEPSASQESLPGTGVVRAILDGPAGLRERDLAALNAFKDVLRGLLWAQEALSCAPVTFEPFFQDLLGAVDTTVYQLALPTDREDVLVADVTQARGVPLRAVALLGLAEGEFPMALAEDPFLRDEDRRRLQAEHGLEIELSTASVEREYFYTAITRPCDALLLTRPRIADNGALWPASPFWEEVRRRVRVEARELASNSYPAPESAASWPELLLSVGARPKQPSLWAWALDQGAERCSALDAATRILQQRARKAGQPPGAYDGDLTPWQATFARRFGPSHVWSASRLESYRACPFGFFVSSVLGLEPRVIPTEGMDARQLGNVYHRILEQLYRSVDDPADLEELLTALPRIVEPILDAAPQHEGFRVTAWWMQTREEIVDHLRRSIQAMHELRSAYVPHDYERAFGIPSQGGPALQVCDAESQDMFLLRGYIDRIDRAPDGRLRIIDYKTGGPWSFGEKEFREGTKLQLPLYALAAQDALGLGEVADGFYWHVRHADWHLEHAQSSSWFSLARAGVAEALERARAYSWEAIRDVRRGWFVPAAPADGCPDYCPAAAFCWQYTPHAR